MEASPTHTGPRAPGGDAYIAGYYAPVQRENPRALLGVWGGTKQRPRQGRRPSAAKSIIRAAVPKDTGPINYLASAAQRRHGSASMRSTDSPVSSSTAV